MSRMVALCSLGTLAAVSVLATTVHVQVPLESSHHVQDDSYPAAANDDYSGWSPDELPDPNSTDHLVFDTVYSLLQHWPNTRMRNGHSIVPGIIPKGTRLYHGTMHKELPPGPEWASEDPEHSYFFCKETVPQHGCWFLTLATTRPLKVVYFDGSSAAKLPYGSLDSQDLILWGSPRPDRQWDEKQRIRDLCQWGKKFDVDGFVRMELDFEVMLCDFTSGLRVVSFANLARPKGFVSATTGVTAFQIMVANSWHGRFPGETRVQLDLAGLVSFYDTQLVPSLVSARAGQERWDHRVRDSSSEDIFAVKSRLEAALVRPSGLSSGIDWKTLTQVIVDRFAGRFELMRYLLNSHATTANELFDLANKTQTQLRVILTPYLLLSATPNDLSDEADLDWTKPVYKLCATIHTDFVESELDSMTDSERSILRAVQGTAREICRVVTRMWAAGVYAGIDSSLNTRELLDVTGLDQLRNNWAVELNRLMAWLDWSVWVKCNPECRPEEICYLPTWPVGFPGFPPKRGPRGRLPSDVGELREGSSNSDLRRTMLDRLVEGAWNSVKPEPDEWIRPQPKCVRQVDTFDF